MNKLFDIVERLLINNEHAILPGLGGFVVQQQPAELRKDCLVPAHTAISFNPLMKHNDGMFIVELSRIEGISYKEAAKQTDKFIADFHRVLKKNQKLAFGRIGEFHLNKDRQLEFTPTLVAEFLPSNFGLLALQLPIPKKENKEIQFSISARKMMRYAAIFITFMALFFSADLNKSAYTTRADLSNLLQFNLPEIIISADTTIQENEEQANRTKPQNVRFAYKLVVATFQTTEKAESFSTQLKSEQYPQAEIIVSSSNTKVCVQSFTSIVAAVNYLEQIKHTDPRFADAWVMKVDSSSN